MKYIVYETTNLVNDKKYIGVHKTENPDIFDNYYGSGKLLKEAIKKYGPESFCRKTLFVFDNDDDAYLKEKELVTKEIVNSHLYYNIDVGGRGKSDRKFRRTIKRKRRREFSCEEKAIIRKKKQEAYRIKRDNKKKEKIKDVESKYNNVYIHKELDINSICFITDGKIEKKVKTYYPFILEDGWRFGRCDKIKKSSNDRVHTEETKEKIKKINTGTVCYTDGVKTIRLQPNIKPPDGFILGMKKIKNIYIWVTNGTDNIRLKNDDIIPDGYHRGRFMRKRK